MAPRLIAATLALALAAPAYANGAMALVYGTFSWNYWLLYVAATVLFEAVVLGRWAKVRFSEALRISLGANVVTGLLGAAFSGIFGYIVYGIGARGYVEPNPLGHAIFCLTIGGALSALIETIFWSKAAGGSALRMSLLVHLAGIPLALTILLLPPRPYAGLEGQAAFRRGIVKKTIARSLSESLQEENSKPFHAPENWEELIKRMQPVQAY